MKKLFFKFWPLFVIISAWLIFSSPYLFKGLVPFPSRYLVSFFPPWSASYGMPIKNNAMPDIISQIYPWKKLTIDTWKQGEIPLWNPYSFSGTAHAGNYQTAIFSPMNLLFFVFSMIDAWSMLILLQPLLAGLFMYLCLRSLERSRQASVVGSLAFMFCGFIVVWMAYGTLGYAALFLPLALRSVFRQFRRVSWDNGLLLALAIVCSFLSGHFQISLYVLGFVLFVILWKTIETKKVHRGLQLFVFVGLGLLIASPQFVLSYDAFMASVRKINFVSGEIIQWKYLATMLSPDFYGNPVTRNDWFGHYAEWSSYVGVVPLLFALATIFDKKSSLIWLFIVTAIGSLLLATVSPFSSLLFTLNIPVLSSSAPSRIIILTSFSLCVLSAFGFDNYLYNWSEKKWKPTFRLIIISGIMLVSIWAMLLVGKPFEPDKIAIASRNTVLPSVLILLSLGFFVVGFFKKRFVTVLSFGIIAVVVFDMLRFSTKWMPYDEREFVFPQTPAIGFLQKTVGINRIFGNIGGEVSNYYALGSLEGYDALYQERYGKFIVASSMGKITPAGRSVVLLDKSGTYSQRALDILGVHFVLHRKSDGQNVWVYPVWKYPFYTRIYEDEHYEIYENAQALPRAFLASGYRIVNEDQAIIDTLFSSDFNLKDQLVLEQKPTLEPAVGQGNLELVSYKPTHIVMKTSSPVAKLLFLSDVYDPGWKAYVDGVATPVLRADYDFRALSVPQGNHWVSFVYKPAGLSTALVVSLGAFIALVFLIKRHENRNI